METLDITKFDPTVEALQKIAEDARAVVVTDYTDKAQLELVATTRKTLKAARVKITNTGKSLREGAVKFQKDVIAKEKELVAIIEPEEDRLSEIEAEIERTQFVASMKLLLPVRRARMESIGYKEPVSDDELNAMSIDDFEAAFVRYGQHVNKLAADKIAADRAKVDADQKKLDDEKAAREREDKAREDERKRIADEQARKDREAAEKKERDEREAKEKIEREAREKKQREADAAFKAWHDGIVGQDPDATYKTAHGTDGTIAVWKLVGTYKPE